MAEKGDNSTPNPMTLAGLWLKSKPSRPSRPDSDDPPPPAAATPSNVAADSQLDLLFSLPPENRPTANSGAPGLAPETWDRTTARAPTPSRRKAASAAADATPASSKRKPRTARTDPPSAPTSVDRRIWTVRDLVTGVRTQLERDYQDIWVEGEISNCRPAPSGHIYFTLKDGEAQLQAVLFRHQAMLLRFKPQDGLAILARGRISVYESRGQLQLIAETLEPRGSGALQLAFELLKARLLAEGLFESARKRPLPAFPHTIGIVTSTGGAVLHDIIKVVRRRHARLNLLVYPAVVQGPGCAASIIAGMDWFNGHPEHVDLILIARGGGSIEDLAGFNDEALARAIAASALPTVSAIGHETDFTIADFVADLRAPTPSAAAELITAAQHRIEERVQALDSRVRRAIRYQIIVARQRLTAVSIPQMQARLQSLVGRRAQRLDDLRHRLEFSSARRLRARTTQLAALITRLDCHDPAARLATARRRLERATEALARLARADTAESSKRLARADARLRALSPLAVLNRGYALVYAADGTLLRDVSATQPGDSIRARLARGSLAAEVKATRPE